jgi:hypothetical protein
MNSKAEENALAAGGRGELEANESEAAAWAGAIQTPKRSTKPEPAGGLSAGQLAKLAAEREAFEAFRLRYSAQLEELEAGELSAKAAGEERRPLSAFRAAAAAIRPEQSTKAEYLERCRRLGALRFGGATPDAAALGGLAFAAASIFAGGWQRGSGYAGKERDAQGQPLLKWRAGRKLEPAELEELENIFHAELSRGYVGAIRAGAAGVPDIFALFLPTRGPENAPRKPPMAFRPFLCWVRALRKARTAARRWLYGKGAELEQWLKEDVSSLEQLLELAISLAKQRSAGDWRELTRAEVAELKTALPPSIPSNLGGAATRGLHPEKLRRFVAWAKWALRAYYVQAGKLGKVGYRSQCEFLAASVSVARGGGLVILERRGLGHLLLEEPEPLGPILGAAASNKARAAKKIEKATSSALRWRKKELLDAIAAGDLLLTNEPERIAGLFVIHYGAKIGGKQAAELIGRKLSERERAGLYQAAAVEELEAAAEAAARFSSKLEAFRQPVAEIPGRLLGGVVHESQGVILRAGRVSKWKRQSVGCPPCIPSPTRLSPSQAARPAIRAAIAAELARESCGRLAQLARGKVAAAVELIGAANRAEMERETAASLDRCQAIFERMDANRAAVARSEAKEHEALQVAEYCEGLADKGAAKRLARFYRAEAERIAAARRQFICGRKLARRSRPESTGAGGKLESQAAKLAEDPRRIALQAALAAGAVVYFPRYFREEAKAAAAMN